MISMKIAVSVLLASTLVVASYAGSCEVKGKAITCRLTYGTVSLAGDLELVRYSPELTNVTLYGHYVGNYLTKMSKDEKRFWQSKNVKSLKIFTTENQTHFSQQSLCIFNQSLVKLDFSLPSHSDTLMKMGFISHPYYETFYGNFTRIPNLACLSHLKKLKLGSHKITAITSDSLKGLISLEELDVSDNQIARIDPDAFSKSTPNLQNLKLEFNNIKMIQKSTFRGHPHLRYLSLFNNKLRSIDDAFQYVPKLESLSLDYNLLTEIAPGTFSKGLPNLNYLGISNNNIKILQYKAFEDLPSLNELVIESNQIQSIDAGTMIGLPNLDKALFGYNNISKISDNAFDGMPNVQVIELWSNSLKSLNQSSFGSMWSSLRSLDVGWNKFDCNCKLKWIVELYRYDKTTHDQPNLIMSCWNAGLHRAIDITKATLQDIHCPTN